MDVMQLRRGLMNMASGHVRMASGEFNHSQSGGIVYLNHNLGSKKILVVMQRINSDHSNIDTSSQYSSIMVCGATKEALQLDETQTYSLNEGTQVHFNGTSETNGAYPIGINSFYPTASGSFPNNGVMAYAYRGVRAWNGTSESDSVVQIYPVYGLETGRWVWRAYALD